MFFRGILDILNTHMDTVTLNIIAILSNISGIHKSALTMDMSHSGRRTGLTNLAERGVGVRTLMALAGHSNMATTQRYIDLRPAMLKAAVELV